MTASRLIQLLLVTSSQCLFAQRTFNVLLTPSESDINTYSFYIDSVVDNRTKKGHLGEVAVGAFNKPAQAVFENGFVPTLKNYLSTACSRSGQQQRIVAYFEELSISEQMYSLTEGGYANVKITFYKKTGDSLSRIKTFMSPQGLRLGTLRQVHTSTIHNISFLIFHHECPQGNPGVGSRRVPKRRPCEDKRRGYFRYPRHEKVNDEEINL